jgi:TatD DNase family protein
MIDTHAHLFMAKAQVSDTISMARAAGVSHIINVATSLENSKTVQEIATKYPMTYPSAGIHPCESGSATRATLEDLATFVDTHNVVAIGEAGLDYYRDYAPRDLQLQVFEFQLELARTHHLPIIIHNRHSDDDMAKVLLRYTDVTKVLHCFSSSWEFAEPLLDQNTYFSFTGSITYSKKGKTINALKHIPMEFIMLETDMPYLTPMIHKGKENSSAYLREIALKIAEVKNMDVEDVIHKTTQTARSFFSL